METSVWRADLKSECVAPVTDPSEKPSKDFLTPHVKLEPVDIKLEPEVVIHDDLPDRILPDSPENEWSESEGEEEPCCMSEIGNNLHHFDKGPLSSNDDLYKPPAGNDPLPNGAAERCGSSNGKCVIIRTSVVDSEGPAGSETSVLNDCGSSREHNGETDPVEFYSCGEDSHRVAAADTHIVTVHRPQKYQCEHCTMKFCRKHELKIHINQLHSDEQIYKCEKCPKKFGLPDRLKNHMKIHKKEKRSECGYCGKKFRQNTVLKIHIRAVHKKEQPYECGFCKKKFAQNTNLNKHISCVHMKEQPYECGQCNKKFAQNTDLNRHVSSVHKKEKPYVCEQCSKKFARNNDLNRHVRGVHKKEQPHRCKFCGHNFARRHNMKRHLNIVHKQGQGDD